MSFRVRCSRCQITSRSLLTNFCDIVVKKQIFFFSTSKAANSALTGDLYIEFDINVLSE